jgi:hypothetical protein
MAIKIKAGEKCLAKEFSLPTLPTVFDEYFTKRI